MRMAVLSFGVTKRGFFRRLQLLLSSMATSIHLTFLPDLLLSFYLLVCFPLHSLWRSLQAAPPKPIRPPLQSYWRQGRFVLVLLAALALVMRLEKHSASDLGLAFPSSPAAMWGLLAAGCLLLGLHLAGTRMERKMTPAQRARQEAQLRDLPFAMPRTPTETAAYLFTMVLMTATWEVLFRGYLLLVLTPVTGLPAAIALAAIAYGAGHGYKHPKQFFGSIAAAFAFTIGYALTGSLWWLIVLHAAAPVSMLFAVRKIQRPSAANEASA
jgi:membrane protease YdiL (CAAX protease family)